MPLLQRSRRLWIPVLFFATVFLAGPPIADGQTLAVVSKSISNGDVNVPTTLDISVTFSDPLSTFGLPGIEVPLDLLGLDLVNESCASLPALIVITPEGCAESWSLTDDGRTLVLEGVSMAEDQVHTMLILFAISTQGDILGSPDLTRFSTGDGIPQGSVSGTVSSADVDVAGSIVVLTSADVFDVLAENDSVGIEPLIGFADDAGNYSVSFAPDGEYFAIGVQLDLSVLVGPVAPASKVTIEGVGVGVYDGDDDGIADIVTIASGGATSGVDVELSSEGGTINALKGPIEALIVAEKPTARLSFGAGAGLEANGKSLTWVYIFTDLISGQAWLSATMGQVAFPPSRFDENEDLGTIGLLLSTAIFTSNADSDQALEWFLAAGGQEFLDENPGALGAGILMDRFLFDLLLEVLQGGGLEFVPGLEAWNEVLKINHIAEGLGAVFSKQQAREAWTIVFIGTGPGLTLHLVSMGDDGAPLLVIGSSTAAENLANADAAANAWDSDANLVGVDGLGSPVNSDGTSIIWSYNYYSTAKDSVLSVIASGGEIGGVLTQMQLTRDEIPSIEPLITDWIDSPEAVEAADDVAVDFLASHVGVTSTAALMMGIQPDHPERGIWRVTYTGGSDDGTTAEKIVDIDASNGVYVAVEDERTLPSTFSLDQNYPNPFNPETVIPYQVTESGGVNLTIFNLLGQEVRVLVNRQRTEGSYQARWDARDGSGILVPSGVYLYRLQAVNSIETRRMTLVR